jgi:hypothetical protein
MMQMYYRANVYLEIGDRFLECELFNSHIGILNKENSILWFMVIEISRAFTKQAHFNIMLVNSVL